MTLPTTNCMTSRTPLNGISRRLLRPSLAAALDIHVPTTDLLRMLDTDWADLTDPDARVDYGTATEVLGLLEARVPDGFAVRSALHATGADYGLLHYLWASSEHYRAGFEAIARFHAVVSTAGEVGQFTLHREGDRTAVRFASGDASAFMMDALFLGLVVANAPSGAVEPASVEGREHLVTNVAAPGRPPHLMPRSFEARFAHPRPDHAEEYRVIFNGGEQLVFDAPHFELVMATDALELPRRTADRQLHSLVSRDASERIASVDDDRPWTRRTEAALRQSLGNQPPAAQRIAASLGVSESTLARRLREERQSFKAVLDELRFTEARRHLRRRELSILEVAYLLGYSNLGTFHRAFRRWAGQAPGEYRRAHRESA